MAYEDIEGQTSAMGQLSSIDSGAGSGQSPTPPPGPPPGATPAGAAGGQGAPPGGPGPDTPQEQQALKLLMQGAMMFRRATEVEPSIRFLIDELLQKAYLGVTKHYGMEQEGKLALQQAQIKANRNKAVAITGPPRPTGMGA